MLFISDSVQRFCGSTKMSSPLIHLLLLIITTTITTITVVGGSNVRGLGRGFQPFNQLFQQSSSSSSSSSSLESTGKDYKDQEQYNNEQPPKQNDIYVSEFEIVEMLDHDGRLQNGFCCNGMRTIHGHGCKGGNTTCLPFWRICIAELQPDFLTMMSREMMIMSAAHGNNHFNQSSLNKLIGMAIPAIGTTTIPTTPTPTTTTTTKKPSLVQSFLSKIFGSGTSTKQPLTDKNKQLKEIIDHMSPTNCNVGFWSSPVIMPDTVFPIRTHRLVRLKPVKPGQMISNRNFVSIVEIWSKNARNDVKNRLITRQINHYNVFVEPDLTLSSEWFYGGKVQSSSALLATNSHENTVDKSTNTEALINNINKNNNNGLNGPKRFRFRYRWHLKTLKKMIEDGYTVEDLDHLNSTSDGCPNGYQGVDCGQPVCLDGCHPDHGYCEQPGQCNCRFGWTGMFCDYCLTLPGCVHGSCVRPLECRCEEGWTGMFCSIPKCKEGCHHTNGYCNQPGECKCKFGWQGPNCTECSTLPGCQHGTCQESLDCICNPGWQGTFCSTPICSTGCENGWCKKPGECRCKIGFIGDNCTECVAYPGCVFGSCHDNKPWTCECQPGYGGFLCDEKLDWCQKNAAAATKADGQSNHNDNPCQNGGTCVSVERENGNYFCKCSIGYTGKDCDQIVQ